MTEERERFYALQQKTYTTILLLGTIGAILALVTNELIGTISVFTRVIFYATIVLLASQAWLLHSRRARLTVVRESVYIGVSAVLLSVLFYALYAQLPRPVEQVSIISLYLWFPFVYLFIFMFYDGRGGLVRSGLLYLLALCVSLPHAVATAGSVNPFDGFQSLGQFYISSAAFIAVLHSFARMRERLSGFQKVADQMSMLAQTDALTNIMNRRGIEVLLEQEIERASRYDLPLSLITFDLDCFKQLNDTLGHDAGDEVLVEITRLVESCLRASDRFGRWGGEEFVILTTETPSVPARQLADRIRETIAAHEFKRGHPLSASFGVVAHRSGESAAALFKRADLALYRAKALGRNRVEAETLPAGHALAEPRNASSRHHSETFDSNGEQGRRPRRDPSAHATE